MKVLFVCNMNQYRSPTAEALFKDRFETKSAGLYGGRLVSREDMVWADTVVVMDDEQRFELVQRFPGLVMQKRVVSFDIPDVFGFNQSELVDLLNSKRSLL
ncbi:phosphotyrosine protein phosphatase [Candidatus Woesearchaeota archaeon]|nr:phosphotyrosine protein phosphatase [Candidatus Woesearchaeota archaeon]